MGRSGLVIKSGSKGKQVENSHGISVYFPQTKISKLYAKPEIAKSSKWDDFLAAYVAAVRIPVGFQRVGAGEP